MSNSSNLTPKRAHQLIRRAGRVSGLARELEVSRAAIQRVLKGTSQSARIYKAAMAEGARLLAEHEAKKAAKTAAQEAT
jgi:precorrin-6B methylase 1